MTFQSHYPGFAVLGLDMGNGRFCAAATDQVHAWQIDHHVDQVAVMCVSDPCATYVPGYREIELSLKTGRLDMTEEASFSRALAALMSNWQPNVPYLSSLRGQAGLMAVTKDMSE